MREEVSAGMVIFFEDPLLPSGEYLLLQYASGYWDLPKGKLEKEETVREAAIREVKEETNLSLEPIDQFKQTINYFFKDREGTVVHKTVTYFCAEAPSRDGVQVSFEHLTYIWLPFNAATKKLTYTNARQLLQMAEQYLQTKRHS